MTATEYDVVRRFLTDRPVAFHPEMARVLGGINEALLFQQMAYWSDKGSDPEWIYKTQAELESETALTRGQQERARKTLRRLGVLEEQRRGAPSRLFYRVNWAAVYELLGIPHDAQNEHRTMRETRRLESGKRASKNARNAHSLTLETESTSESTRDDTGQKKLKPMAECTPDEWIAQMAQVQAERETSDKLARALEGIGWRSKTGS